MRQSGHISPYMLIIGLKTMNYPTASCTIYHWHHSSKFIWFLWQLCSNKILQISWTPARVLIFSCLLLSRGTMLWLLKDNHVTFFCDFLYWCWEGLSVSIIGKKTQAKLFCKYLMHFQQFCCNLHARLCFPIGFTKSPTQTTC